MLLLSNAAYAVPANFADLVEDLMPAVVNISTTQKISVSKRGFMRGAESFNNEDFADLFQVFPGLSDLFDKNQAFAHPNHEKKRKAISLGSGFLIDADGYIVTNNHVIADAEEIIVYLADNKEYKAKVIGFDTNTDLALLKINAKKPLAFVKFGDSEQVRVGEWVIAIGNQLGFGSTVTAGIISSKARDINAGGIVDNFIQTDAAINRGSSGGPMFNLKGEVIGINTAIVTPSMGNVGIGFATPASIAKPVLSQLRKSGRVTRPYLGVKIQPVDDEIVESLGLSDNKGALIVEISPESPADKANLKPGDIILSFDGKEISKTNQLPRIVAETNLAKKVEIIYLRKNQKKSATITLAELKDKLTNQDEAANTGDSQTSIHGLVLSKITPQLREKYEISPNATGCVIVKILPKGLWTHRGLKIGDIIVEANQEPISSLEDLQKVINNHSKRKSILLLISRLGQKTFISMPLNIKG